MWPLAVANDVSPIMQLAVARKKRTVTPDPRFGESFSFGDIVKFTNASRSNLIHWANKGIIRPDVEDTAGPGFPATIFSIEFC